MTKTVPEGYNVKGVSTLYNSDGAVAAQWVKSTADEEQRKEAQREFVSELVEIAKHKPRKRVAAPKRSLSDLMVGYPLGDHHFGMYAHAAESGADYDLKIAKEVLATAVDDLVSRSPPAEEALFANLGDALHMDSRANRTPNSGHALDVDTRYSKVARTAAFGIAHSVHRLLERHARVRVINVPGNHDQDSATWLSLVLEAWFRNEPRVTLDVSPSVFLFHQFGQNMLCLTHGHTIKMDEIPGTMAAYRPEMWGATKYRVAWIGHWHHKQRLAQKEGRGATVEGFGVLPPNDAFGASLGVKAQREMNAVIFQRSGGEIGRSTHNVELS
jgi:predicted phosphodiesterase